MDFELKIVEWFQKGRTRFGDFFFNGYAYLASIFAVIVFALVVFFLYDKKVGIAFAVTSGFAAGTAWILKRLIKRPRPFSVAVEISNIGQETGYSMPSGHSVAAIVIFIFILYIAFKHYQKKGRIICSCGAVAYLLLMAVDRMYLGAHYISDIFAGWIVGFFFCVLAGLFFPRFFNWTDKLWENHKKKKEIEAKSNSNEGEK